MKTKKKGLHQIWNTLFPRILVETCAQMHTRVKLFGGDTDVDHTQIIGGDAVKLLWGIYAPIPPGFRHPCPGVALLLLTQCHYRLFISRPETNARRKRKEH